MVVEAAAAAVGEEAAVAVIGAVEEASEVIGVVAEETGVEEVDSAAEIGEAEVVGAVQ